MIVSVRAKGSTGSPSRAKRKRKKPTPKRGPNTLGAGRRAPVNDQLSAPQRQRECDRLPQPSGAHQPRHQPAIGMVFQLQLQAVQFGYALDDGQTKSAARLVLPRRAEETLTHPFQ